MTPKKSAHTARKDRTMSTTTEFKTNGMHCPSCSLLIEMTLDDVAGVERVKVDLGKSLTTVDYDPQVVTDDDIIGAIAEAGYSASVAA
jgi:copper chaperone CopZ